MRRIPKTFDGSCAPLTEEVLLLERFLAIHRDQLALCEALEAIADGLPDHVDRQECLHAARALGPVVGCAHAFEEEVLFPVLQARWLALASLERTLERLSYEHFEDNCFAEELCDALMAYGRGEPWPAPEAFGYMLRGFFETLRRHVAGEADLLVPLFERRDD